MKKESCPECRREMKIDKILNETEAIMECQHCKKTFKFTYDEKTFPSNINSFNWGAFFIGGLWGFWNGSTGYALTVCSLGLISRNFFLSIICTPIIFALGLFYGFKGNKISWSQKDWPSIESFEQSQTRWCMAGWIVIVLISIFELVIMYPN
ncbi:hypothetical protein [Parabacteroides sp.]|jgi:hypothetical protein|uniref:hypothetical protein n=1 Tax=Parabacteroides TaxID=375288 RepID=UPI00257F07E7|nr:hypothetical protein [Parabacteroides sp.]